MLKKLVALALVVFLALVFDISLCARGLVWDFLADTHIDGAQIMTGSRSAFGTARSARFSCE